MRRLFMITALVLMAGLALVPAALAQEEEDEVTVQEGPPLTASPSANLEDDVILTTTTPTATVTVQEGPPLTASPTAKVAAKDQYDGGGGAKDQYDGGDGAKKVVVVGGGGRTLPETGGVSSLALLAGVLLIGGGVMGLALFRRS